MPIEGIFIPRIEGTRLEVWIPSLSILVAKCERPVLRQRRGDETPMVGHFDLHAVYSFLNESLFRDDDFQKVWTFWLGRKPGTLTLEGSRLDLNTGGRTIRIEGVDLIWQHQ